MTIYQFTASLTFFLLMTLNVVAQKNISIQPKAASASQSEAVIKTQKSTPELKPLFQQTSQPTPASATAKKESPVSTSAPLFRTASRPKIDKSLDAKIRQIESEIARRKAQPNRDKLTLMKYEAALEYLLDLERKNTNN